MRRAGEISFNNGASRDNCYGLVGYLRSIRPAEPMPPLETSCLEAYERELDYLFETLRRLGAGPRDVEDLAQEVFVVLRRNWANLDATRSLRPYLFGIAFRIVSAHRRKWRREVLHDSLELADGGQSPEVRLQSKESVELLLAALEHVPLPCRAVLVMHELEGIPIPEIARQLSLTRFGAYARLRKAHRALGTAVRRLVKEKKAI